MWSWHFAFLCKSALNAKSKSILSRKLARATNAGFWARAVVSCWMSAHANKPVRGGQELTIEVPTTYDGSVFLPSSSDPFSHKIRLSINVYTTLNPGNLFWELCPEQLQKTKKTSTRRRGATRLWSISSRLYPCSSVLSFCMLAFRIPLLSACLMMYFSC